MWVLTTRRVLAVKKEEENTACARESSGIGGLIQKGVTHAQVYINRPRDGYNMAY